LAPGETRTLQYNVGVKDAKSVAAKVLYAKFPPEMYAKLNEPIPETVVMAEIKTPVGTKHEDPKVKTDPLIPSQEIEKPIETTTKSHDGKIVHVNGDAEFRSQVLNSSIPVVVDFWAVWCKPCKMIEPIIESFAKQYAGKIKFVKVNLDRNRSLARKYRIRGIPAMVMFKNGKEADREVGLVPEYKLKRKMEKLIK
jgi:thioredoxin 1